ncbi:MAG: hypothetical protein QXV17_09270 [Candidatus Micrarchaeaceae archaeon]
MLKNYSGRDVKVQYIIWEVRCNGVRTRGAEFGSIESVSRKLKEKYPGCEYSIEIGKI